MASANQYLEDWSNSSAINILRVGSGQRNAAIRELEKLERELIKEVASNPGKGTKKEMQELLRSTRKTIESTYARIEGDNTDDLERLAKTQIVGTDQALNGAIGIPLIKRVPTETQIEAVMRRSTIQGHSSREWWQAQEKDLAFKFEGQMREGYLRGEDTAKLTRRIRGTRANGFKDGLMNAPKHQAETLARTSVQTVSNEARLATMEEHDDLVKSIKWVATLDHRTTDTCKALDGKQWTTPDYKPIGHDKEFPGATAHWGCRSTQSPVLPSLAELTGKKIKTLDNQKYEDAVKKRLKEMGMSQEQRDEYKANSRASIDGQVPKTETYGSWLEKKPDSYQNAVLGPTRASLFRDGNLTIEQLTNHDNRPLTVRQLQEAVESPGPELAIETEGGVDDSTAAAILKLNAIEGESEGDQHFNQGEEISLRKVGFKGGGENAKGGYSTGPKDDHKWREVELDLAIHDVYNVQGSVIRKEVEKKIKSGALNDPQGLPTAFYDPASGNYTLVNGNHRAVSQALVYNGRIKVNVVGRKPGRNKATFSVHNQPELPGGAIIGKPGEAARLTKPTDDGKTAIQKNKAAQEKIDEIAKNPKGKTLLAKSIKQVQKDNPELSPSEALAKAEGIATEKQAAASRASKLSTAKKKLVAGKKPTASEQRVIDELGKTERNRWMETVDDAKIAAEKTKPKAPAAATPGFEVKPAKAVTAKKKKEVNPEVAKVLKDKGSTAILDADGNIIGAFSVEKTENGDIRLKGLEGATPQARAQALKSAMLSTGEDTFYIDINESTHKFLQKFDSDDEYDRFFEDFGETGLFPNGKKQVVDKIDKFLGEAATKTVKTRKGKPVPKAWQGVPEHLLNHADWEPSLIPGQNTKDWVAEVSDVMPYLGTKDHDNALLQAWGSGAFSEINAAKPTKDAKIVGKEFVKLVDSLPAQEDPPEIFRALGFHDNKERDSFLQSLGKPGQVFTQDRAITAWTAESPLKKGATPMNNIALDLAESFGDKTVILRMKEGTGAKDISYLYGKESNTGGELLYTQGSKFKIGSVTHQDDGKIVVEMERQ